MSPQRLPIAALCFVCLVPALLAQRSVDPKYTYHRLIGVVPLTGSGTPSDPKRPLYAPWPASTAQSGIIAFQYEPTDDGTKAVVEFVARSRSAFQAIFNDSSVTVFEKGVAPKSTIEAAIQPVRKDFTLDTFGVVMP